MIRVRTLLVFLGVLLAVPAVAWPETEEEREREEAEAGILKPLVEQPFNQAREESGVKRRPRSRHALPGGELRVSAEILAGGGHPVRFRLGLNRVADPARLRLRLPSLWLKRGVSGLPFARVPGGRRTVVLDADRPMLDVDNVGIPAGTYRVRYRLRRGGDSVKTGVARVVFYAQVREQHAPSVFTDDLRAPVNATADAFEESEAFDAVRPGNSDRLIVGINSNDIDPCCSAWISDNRGATYTKATLPSSTDAPGTATPEIQDIGGDPMHAADDQGNLWYGNLTLGGPGATPNRIVVNRVAAGTTTFLSQNVGLKFDTNGFQDKNLMTIDMHPTSPTYGRLYVVWGDPGAGGGVDMAIVSCDTRPGGVLNVANCDNADNWTAASRVATDGSFIYADVAIGPDGKVYVTWWDYSSDNAIEGKVCDPTAVASTNCDSTADWNATSISTIATLDTTGGTPIDFACPIVAQPGGRAGPAPQVEVSDSDGATGRVYVTWSDLRADSGATRCDGFTDPALTHLTWDSFVASATGAFPGGASPSTSVGTRLYTDGESGAASSNSDEWFPWLSVDQTTGQAYADFYSTRDDTTRQTTHFYLRAVTPSGGTSHSLGSLLRVSSAPSDYSFISPCCQFTNDYGDYEGLDAAEGSVFPVWTDNSTGDGEAFTVVPTLSITPQSATFTEIGGDGDGVVEPGEEGDLSVVVVNNGTAGATGTITGTLSESDANITITQGTSTYPTPLRSTLSGASVADYQVQVDPGATCASTAALTLTFDDVTQQDNSALIDTGGSLLLPITCPPGAITGLVATPQVQAVGLDWSDTPGATSYEVFRDGVSVGTPATSDFVDTGRTPGVQYCYTVQATNAAGDGPLSSQACATPLEPGSPPGAIVGLTATAGVGSVALDWSDIPAATGYDVFRGGTQIASPTASSHTDSGLPAGTQQCYAVQAKNSFGLGPLSNQACATPTNGGGPEDLDAPSVALGGARRQRIGRTRSVTVRASCNEACGLTATGTAIVPGAARSFKLRGVTRSAPAGTSVSLKLRLTRKTVRAVRKALRARRRVRARVTVIATDAVGNARTVRTTVRARR